jgi:membrane protease YdiL (CAAX protease family)
MTTRSEGGLVRQLLWYFGGLIAIYGAGLAVFWPHEGEKPNQAVFLVIMLAPTAGALLVRFFGGGRIQWGRPSLWILAGLLPTLTALGAYLVAASAGWVSLDTSLLWLAVVSAPLSIVLACLSALGEEIGWRGFLWPTLRRRTGFRRTSVIILVIWWAYHVPLILLGWYGTLAGLPAFTVAITGFVLFVGVLTDRARSLWPSVIAHGSWNALVATSFAVASGTIRVPAFDGDPGLLGEFGWLAAVTTAVLGGLTAWWHVSHPMTSPGATRHARAEPESAGSEAAGRESASAEPE